MMIARWSIDIRFGHRQAAIALMRKWWQDIAPQVGWSAEKMRLLSGSIGVEESRIEVEVEIDDLVDLQRAWSRMGLTPDQERWAKELADHVVSGSPRWTVYRTL